MKISEVAKIVDLPISTIRYYEKIGIITDDYILREENNYRNYAPEIIHHLDVVKNCLAVGFSINDVKSMIRKMKCQKMNKHALLKKKYQKLKTLKKN